MYVSLVDFIDQLKYNIHSICRKDEQRHYCKLFTISHTALRAMQVPK